MKKIIFLSVVLFACINSIRSQTKPLDVGDTIPSFSLKDQNGNTYNVKDDIGKKILVIYFYPKDESAVCTKEACGFRDRYADLSKAGALVIGINSGTVESHKSFQDNHKLPFILLSDPGNKVLKLFGVKGKFFFTGRKTFVVALDGKIVYTFDSFTKGTEHSEKVLEFIKQSNPG